MDPGIYDLYGKCFGELGERSRVSTPDPDLEAGLTIETHAHRGKVRLVGAPEDHQPRGLVAHQPFSVARAKRTPAAQQVDGLEQRSLAGAVGAGDEIDVCVQLEPGGLEAAQALDFECQQTHAGLRAASA